ncbi:MAG: VCBS repeat-containing protein [Bacteroidetes bacterium]|nr:VCBS repeat-containing protein [Bacteroidota bacterium]
MRIIYSILIAATILNGQNVPFADRTTTLNVPKQTGNYGTAVADYNNDGYEDIFISNVPNLAGTDTSHCVLLRNNAGENFTDVTAAAGMKVFGSFKCGIWGDVNNDGYPDLFMAESFQHGRSHLMINKKDGTFRDVAVSGINYQALASTAAFGDYDNDGRLDLFIATEFPEYDLLYRNISVGDSILFTDVSTEAGIGGFSSTASMQATFIDIDHDGDLDLYAVHDGFLPSSLFRNNGDGTFSDISFQTGLHDYGAGNSMGVYWKDFDFDGWEEVYITRIGKGGLYKRQPDGKYLNIADTVAADFNGMTWGVVWEDFDNDADDDLFMVSTYGHSSVGSLYYENTGGSYLERSKEYGINYPHAFYGLAYGDFNNDGYLDLVASATDGKNVLLINTQKRTGKWITITLTGTTVNRMAVGSSVRLLAGGRRQLRTVTAGNSYASGMSHRLHFGLGSIPLIDTLQILWSNGSIQTFTGLAVNTHYRLTQNGSLLTNADRAKEVHAPKQFRLHQNFPNPFNPATSIQFSIPQDGHVSLEVFDLLGRLVRTVTDEVRSAGQYTERLNLTGLASGLYLYRLRFGERSEVRKLMLLQ